MHSNLHARPNARLSARAASLALLTLLALPASAVTVLNHSFESSTIADGSPGVATSWTLFNTGGALGNGAYNPLEENFTGATGTGTPLGADGTNVFSTNVGTTTPGQSGAYQVLTGEALTAGTTYTMTVAIGDYLGLTPGNWHLAISTSSMGVGTYLSDFSGSAGSLTDDQFNDFSVSYTATGAESQIGEDMKITFWGQNDAGGQQFVPFDNVRLTAVAIPEPSAALLGGLGLLFLARRRRN